MEGRSTLVLQTTVAGNKLTPGIVYRVKNPCTLKNKPKKLYFEREKFYFFKHWTKYV
jgi:hypothetical protein